MLLSTDIMLPRYLKDGTTDSMFSATVKTGGVGGMLVLHWQITSVLVVLMVSPILLYALTAASRTDWRPCGE